MVEIFKTNIKSARQSRLLIKKLLEQYPDSLINFDLDDCDNVLRVEGENICPEKIIELVTGNNYQCEVLY